MVEASASLPKGGAAGAYYSAIMAGKGGTRAETRLLSPDDISQCISWWCKDREGV